MLVKIKSPTVEKKVELVSNLKLFNMQFEASDQYVAVKATSVEPMEFGTLLLDGVISVCIAPDYQIRRR